MESCKESDTITVTSISQKGSCDKTDRRTVTSISQTESVEGSQNVSSTKQKEGVPEPLHERPVQSLKLGSDAMKNYRTFNVPELSNIIKPGYKQGKTKYLEKGDKPSVKCIGGKWIKTTPPNVRKLKNREQFKEASMTCKDMVIEIDSSPVLSQPFTTNHLLIDNIIPSVDKNIPETETPRRKSPRTEVSTSKNVIQTKKQ